MVQLPADSDLPPEDDPELPNRLFSVLIAATLGLIGSSLLLSAVSTAGVTAASPDGVAAAVLIGAGGAFCALGCVQSLRTALTGQPATLWPIRHLQHTAALYLLGIGDYTLAWGQLLVGSLLVAVAVVWLRNLCIDLITGGATVPRHL